MKYCRLCGRRLKDPESIKIGIGPVCLDKLVTEIKRKNMKAEKVEDLQIPGQMEVREFMEG